MEERMEVVMNNIPLICTLVGVIGVLFSIILAAIVKNAPAGDEKMQRIANAVKEGAIAYLNRQMKSMGIAGAVIFIVIFATMGAKTAIGFLVGAVASFMAGYIGMRVSVIANVRTAEAAKKGHGRRPVHGIQRWFRYRYDRCRPGPHGYRRLLRLHP